MSFNFNGVMPVVDCSGDKGFTVQADRKDADINEIVGRFQKSGALPPTLHGEPFYGDVTGFEGLAEALIKIQEADELFMSFDAKLRERFDNDYVKFVSFLEDPKNLEEAVKLGLVQPKPVEPPAPPAPVGGTVK